MFCAYLALELLLLLPPPAPALLAPLASFSMSLHSCLNSSPPKRRSMSDLKLESAMSPRLAAALSARGSRMARAESTRMRWALRTRAADLRLLVLEPSSYSFWAEPAREGGVCACGHVRARHCRQAGAT